MKESLISNKDAWLIRVVYKVRINSSEYVLDDAVTNAAYINIDKLTSSTDMFEQAIVEVDRTLRIAS